MFALGYLEACRAAGRTWWGDPADGEAFCVGEYANVPATGTSCWLEYSEHGVWRILSESTLKRVEAGDGSNDD